MNRNLTLTAALCMTFLCSGCAIAPNTLRIETEHVSHLTQHFEADPTNFGYNALTLELHWQRRGWFADVSEGLVLNARDRNINSLCYGALAGPREVFAARMGWELSLHN